MLESLSGKVAWVTGGGTGIGEGAALALARDGAKVIISGRRPAELERVCASIRASGGDAEAHALDVADPAAVQSIVNAIHAKHGRLDVLVHSAGMNIRQRAWRDSTPEDFERLTRINVNGAYHCCRAVLPIMREQRGGLIVAISSWAGRHASVLAGGPYSASKHALNALVETINMEECAHGIRATAVCPGEVATAILDERPQPPSAEDRARMLQPEDLGEVIAFLARLPARVCVNDLLVAPTWNRAYLGSRTP